MNAAANLLEKKMGDITVATTPFANPADDAARFADPSGEKMKALAWFGKNDVRVIEAPKPRVVDEEDVVLKVTGSTVCGASFLCCFARDSGTELIRR
jgi:hypothetical protein